MSKFFFVARILGRRTFLIFGLFTFACVSVISATHIVSRHALKQYVEDQLNRIDWDIAVHQRKEISTSAELLSAIRAVPGVRRAEELTFLGARIPPTVTAKADNAEVVMPWFVVLAASDPELLPPEYRSSEGQITLALFGVREMVQYYMGHIQGARTFSFSRAAAFDSQDNEGGASRKADEDILSLPIYQIVQLDREEFNRWSLEHTGAVPFVPYVGAALNIGNQPSLVSKLDYLFKVQMERDDFQSGAGVGHEQHGEYLPEIIHLASIDRKSFISGWDIEGSYQRITALRQRVEDLVPWDAGATVRSDTQTLLGKMRASAQMIDQVTFLLALPVVIMAWVFAANLMRFVLMNERRKIGLMRLRGLHGSVLNEVILFSVISGGLAGGIAGLIAGTVLPLAAYEGIRAVPHLMIVQPPLLAAGFLGIGLAVALVIGVKLALAMNRLSPNETVRRFSPSVGKEAVARFSVPAAIAVLLGGYTVVSWWHGALSLPSVKALRTVNGILDFIGVPLLTYGITVLVASRKELVTAAIRCTSPLCVGRLKGFAADEVSKNTARVSGVFLIGSLSAAIVLAPSVAMRCFSDKALRGAKVEMGAENQVLFNTLDIPGQPADTLGPELNRIQSRFQDVLSSIRKAPDVEAVTGVTKALIPVFMPGKTYSGVPLYLLDNPSEYLSQVYSEESLGVDRPFSLILQRVQQGAVAVSPALASFYGVHAGDHLQLGLSKTGRPIAVEVAGILSTMPGSPKREVTDRDGFVTALSDYLNYLFTEDAFIVSSASNPAFADESALVPQFAALVTSRRDLKTLDGLPLPPRAISSLASELERVQRDMFIFLVGENLKIYLAGGFAVALSAIIAIFLVNYWEDRRTFALLRVRGSSPTDLVGTMSLQLCGPLVWSLLLGGVVGAIGGYGVAQRIWNLQRVLTIIQQLPTHLIITWSDIALVVIVLALLSAFIVIMACQVFRLSPREAIAGE